MPYLSRIRINPRRSGAQALLTNPHKMKIEVLNGLPDRSTDEAVLWRLDAPDPHRPHLLVLTHSRPDWSHIVERAGWPDADGEHSLVRDYSPLLAQLAVGREFAFRLTANPVQNTKEPLRPSRQQHAAIETAVSPKERRGFRVGHRTAQHQLAWLLKRAEKSGFTIPEARMTQTPAPGMLSQGAPAPDVRLASREVLRFHKRRDGSGKPSITISTATFEGRLRITDTCALHTTLLHGLGPSKRYGCGLLTLAPLSEARRHG
ncbi:type I-E CRISPR-associated protein Cas6/Cse3/CasE [Nocardiopsis rhodophaea]|uniref:Type I-E CRISPR-associated protein Cas6/Cse3/CasE n=1 Tax=Nocardiopsis rhodophaea TaxID=280238 RepID=A0ABP5F0Y2_9ACTN